MDDEIESLMIDVRAGTQGFRQDVETMRGMLDATLVEGFAKAGATLEGGLLSAIRRGRLGFDELKRVALRTLDEIAAAAMQAGIGEVLGGRSSGGGGSRGGGLLGELAGGAVADLLGLPGRATGGPVAPSRPYLVGERGPEMFVPTAAGRVEPGPPITARPRDVRVAIRLPRPQGTETPVALRRSARQVASSVRRALADS